MWLFLWDSEPSKIFVGDTSISKVFLWDTQVRPSGWWGWQPWANTYAYYPFNGDVDDYSWNNRNLTDDNLSYELFNWFNVAILDRPSMAYSNIGTYFSWSQNFTIMLYVRVKTYTHYTSGRFFRFSANFNPSAGSESRYDKAFQISSSWDLSFNVYDNGRITTPSGNISFNNWHHIAWIFDGSKIELYIDGINIGNTNATSSYGCDYLVIGNCTQTFNGNISNVIIEDKARTAQEVLDYFNQTKGDYWIS